MDYHDGLILSRLESNDRWSGRGDYRTGQLYIPRDLCTQRSAQNRFPILAETFDAIHRGCIDYAIGLLYPDNLPRERTRLIKLSDKLRQVAWNGIQFNTPAHWEIGRIGSRHLVLEDEEGPVMEVKWGIVKGRFSHKTHLKRLVASQSRRLKGRIAEWYLPPPWEKALSGFEARGFLWEATDGASGRGAILFCRICRHATLIQFFGDSSAKRERVLLTVLRSFQDHRQDDRILWSIFDIKAKLPGDLKLLRYRFEAGKYQLVFNDGPQYIYLQRWAPAAAILAGRDLVWFSGTIPEFAPGHSSLPAEDECKAVEWSISPGGKWHQIMCRLKPKPSYFWYRLWHLEDKNRILSVRAESRRPLDFQLLRRISKDYESL